MKGGIRDTRALHAPTLAVAFPAHFSILSTPTQTDHLTAYLTNHLTWAPDSVPHDLTTRDHSHDPMTRHPDSTMRHVTRCQTRDCSLVRDSVYHVWTN